MRIKNILLLISLLIGGFGFSQSIQIVNPSMTPTQAVQDVLLGAGVNAFNIKFNGSTANAGVIQSSVRQFNNAGSNFPISDGILLQTLNAPSVNLDPDLNAISGSASPTNGVVLEFDFIPDGNILSFQYIFASSEYTNYTCSQFNDVFGFFISGPGLSGPFQNNAVNIATIPNSTTPVGINTVNSGIATGGSPGTCASANPNWLSDSQYWTNSYNQYYTSGIGGFNGSTVVLTAESGLICGEVYHIKMAISNVSDGILDSGVFLEANSFSAAGVNISIETNTETSDTLLIAGCTQGIVHFTRPSFQTDDSLDVVFHTSGTLVEGVDYPFLAGGDSIVTFLPGQDSISILIAPFPSNTPGDPHELTIFAYSVNECGDTVFSNGTIWVLNEPYSTVTATDTLLFCSSDSIPLFASTNNPFGLQPYTYTWTLLDDPTDSILHTGIPYIAEIYANDTVHYLVTSTDACGFQYVDTATVIMAQTLAIDSLIQYPADCGMNNGAVVAFTSGATTPPSPTYTWTDSNNDTIPGNEINATAWPDRAPGWYYFSIEDIYCKVSDSILVEPTPPPSASFTANPTAGFSPLEVNFTNTSEPAESYEWDFGNGEGIIVNDLSGQNTTYFEEGIYTVTLTLTEGECTDVATATIIVEEYLPIIIEHANVFSPNNDGVNDNFHLNIEYAAEVTIIILNRWGNLVFESTDPNFQWNGKIQNVGAECTDGVYFYKVDAVDLYGEEHQEHGFVHLIRN